MSDETKRPNVFPNQKQIDEANQLSEKLNSQIFDKLAEMGTYDNLSKDIESPIVHLPEGERRAAAEMEQRRNELSQKVMSEGRPKDGRINGEPLEYRPELAEYTPWQGEVKYGSDEAPQSAPKPVMNNFQYTSSNQVETASDAEYDAFKAKITAELEEKYRKLSQPQTNVPYDTIPLPSKGKVYYNKRPSIDIAYLNASDENILTNPNLLESGRFLEILINRKLMGTDLTYKDLHVGDRNAIMIWLRSTAYGTDYPIKVYDPATGKQFETIIDLNQLKMIELEEETDAFGHLSFTLPISKNQIKFKLLTVGDIDEIDEHIELVKKELGEEFLDTPTYILKKQITAINGYKDKSQISEFVDQMLMGDVKAFRKHIDSVESGMDMNLTVMTPGGESIKTYFPLNLSFFWPDL